MFLVLMANVLSLVPCPSAFQEYELQAVCSMAVVLLWAFGYGRLKTILGSKK